LSTVDPEALGHKALAVNLSDLAAMGAEPLAFTLALALPRVDACWLEGFSRGLLALADAHQCVLMGGDTTAGPLNICITVFGQVPHAQALRRDAAVAGDDIWVSGSLGEARLALEVFRGTLHLDTSDFVAARARMERPSPQIALGIALRGVAHAAADISDGLLGDLGHILTASRVGAVLNTDWIAKTRAHDALLKSARADFLHEYLYPWVLTGGDDYELLFTAPASQREAVRAAGATANAALTRIGHVTAEAGLRMRDAQGQPLPAALVASWRGFDHFATASST
jgi:thiamine-monophosphate kinase